jgi:hypothetical protein
MGEPPYELEERLRMAWRDTHGRMSDLVAFQLPLDQESLRRGDLTQVVPTPAATAVLQDMLPEGTYELNDADVGRGASGLGLALEIANDTLTLVSNVGGALAFGSTAYHFVKQLRDRLHTATGEPPCVGGCGVASRGR